MRLRMMREIHVHANIKMALNSLRSFKATFFLIELLYIVVVVAVVVVVYTLFKRSPLFIIQSFLFLFILF